MAWYRCRKENERPFWPFKGLRRIFSRFDQPDLMFMVVLPITLVVEALRCCESALARQEAGRIISGLALGYLHGGDVGGRGSDP